LDHDEKIKETNEDCHENLKMPLINPGENRKDRPKAQKNQRCCYDKGIFADNGPDQLN